MKTLLLIFTLALSVPVYTQVAEYGKWKIGVSFSANRDVDGMNNCNQDMIINNYTCDIIMPAILPGGCYSPLIEQVDIAPRFNYSAGIVSHYAIRPRLELGLGVTYHRNTMNYWEAYSDPLYCGPYYMIAWPPQRLLEVPMFVRYHFLGTQFDIHTEGGVNTGFALNSRFQDRTRFTLRVKAGVGMNCDLGKDFNLSLTAFYTRKLTDFKQFSTWDTNALSAELRLLYTLK